MIVLADSNTDVLAAIRADPCCEIGEGPVHGRLPVVLETKSVAEDRAKVRWLEGLPGVALVEVAYHDFSDTTVDRQPDEGGGGTREDSEGARR
ncbi:MAG: chaperone NapD [Phycisphaerae bacterium]|nr:chaperone NapD [Phycisphaerae bacterium]NNF43658.1 hypothetical protein [Phycisphaerales bacterium]